LGLGVVLAWAMLTGVLTTAAGAVVASQVAQATVVGVATLPVVPVLPLGGISTRSTTAKTRISRTLPTTPMSTVGVELGGGGGAYWRVLGLTGRLGGGPP